MKESIHKRYDDLPLFLNSDLVAKTLCIAPSSAYERCTEKNFPTLRIGSRMVVPKEKFIEWVKRDELMKRFLDTVRAADAAALQNFSGEETSKA